MGNGAAPKWWFRRSNIWTWIAAIAFVTLAISVVARVLDSPPRAGDGETCRSSTSPLGGSAPVPDVSEGVLMPADQQLLNFVWVFGPNDTVQKFETKFVWAGDGRPAALNVGDVLLVGVPGGIMAASSRERSIPTEQITANAVVTPDGVKMNGCVDTSGVTADRYTSTLVFDDTDIESAPFALDITVKNRAEWLPIVAIVAGIALGFILLLLTFSTSGAKPLEAVVVVVIGTVLTLLVGASPWSTWQADPTWGRSRFDAVLLAAATALALVGAASTSDTMFEAAEKFNRRGSQRDPAPIESDSTPASPAPTASLPGTAEVVQGDDSS